MLLRTFLLLEKALETPTIEKMIFSLFISAILYCYGYFGLQRYAFLVELTVQNSLAAPPARISANRSATSADNVGSSRSINA